MRFDKLTTKFQQALADAQSAALGNDNGFIEPQHLLVGAPQPGRRRHRVAARPRRRRRPEAQDRAREGDRAPAQGRGPGRRDRRLARPRQPPEPHRPRGDQARRPVHRLGTLPAGPRRRQGRHRPAAEGARAHPQGARGRDRRGARRRRRRLAGSRRAARGAEEIHHRPHRARAPRQARPGDRPRRRDPPHHPDPPAPHQEQPGADRRAGRGQDGDRRGPRAAHRQRRSPRNAQEQARAVARHGGAPGRHQVPRRIRGAPEGRAEGHCGR